MKNTFSHSHRVMGFLFFVTLAFAPGANAEELPQFSGIYPHLAMYNQEDECGTGAVVPWAGRLWVISYGPHLPFGSSDKLYEIDDGLNRITRPESVGGTHANRMIHRESKQLFIGSYAIDENRTIRVIPSKEMPGRLTGNARHLFDPLHKIYYASMEEGFYEVDVNTLAVQTINLDGNARQPADLSGPLLPGYHGKGLYSSQGRLVYANNGENTPEARLRPDITSGCLAEWDGKNWNVVLRNQFTEVTGPGGIFGNESEDDPLWSLGWDDRSVILMLLDGGEWRKFRLPKASHTYDGAHGWHTEWPRIREIKPDYLLMTMHGMFWRFPKTFSRKNTAGIQALSTYLKIIGDFCEWNGKVVFGCDDAAKSDFLTNGVFNLRGTLCNQSNSNLWFVDPERLYDFGPVIGRGGPWKNDPVKAGVYSDPFLFSGFDYRMAHIVHNAGQSVDFTFEIDAKGTGEWSSLQTLAVPASGYAYTIFDSGIKAQWIRVKANRNCNVTLIYQLANHDKRTTIPDPIFNGLAKSGEAFSSGIIRPRGENLGTLHFAATNVTRDTPLQEAGYYEIGQEMKLERKDDAKTYQWLKDNHAIGEPLFTMDEASVLVIDSSGKRYRLPKGDPTLWKPTAAGWPRTFREVVTERNLFHCQGNWYELPRQNSGGFAKIRPIASSNLAIYDLCSWRGMLALSGVSDTAADNPRIIRSDDGRCALWFGTIDDLWKLGKPRGEGSVWKNTKVKAGETSDPYLMTGYDFKTISISHASDHPIAFPIEIDITSDGDWVTYHEFTVKPGETRVHSFPEGFNAYWVRLKSPEETTATATITYN